MTSVQIDQMQDSVKIYRFFEQKASVLHFLALAVICTVLLVVFAHPTALMAHTEQLSQVNQQLQLAVAATVAVVLLCASRFLLQRVGPNRHFAPMGYLIWLLVELIVIIAAMSLTLWRTSGGGRMMLAPLAADLLLGVIAVEVIPYVVAFLLFLLRQERAENQQLRESLNALRAGEREELAPTGERILNFYNKGGRLTFSVEAQAILFIEAADNYTNIHYLNEGREDTYILHNTLKVLERELADTTLMRCHRGYMVNLRRVRQLRRERTLLLLDLDGSNKVVPVTKTYADQLEARLGRAE